MKKLLLGVGLSLALLIPSARADNIKGPVVKPYTPGSNGIALGPGLNKTGATIFDFRLWLKPGNGEAPGFNLDASDCDVDPGPNPAGDGAGQPDFDPTDNVDDKIVKLRTDLTNGLLDQIKTHPVPGTNNPFHVVVDFTQASTKGGSVTITPTDFDCHDLVAKDNTSQVSRETYSVPLGGGARMITTQVTYVDAPPVSKITLAVADPLRIVRADVNPQQPADLTDDDYCTLPEGCWFDLGDQPDYDPDGMIPPEGVTFVTLLPVSGADTIQSGETFVIQFELLNPVDVSITIAAIGIDMDASIPPIPTVSEWGLIVMTLLGLTVGTILLGRRRGAIIRA